MIDSAMSAWLKDEGLSLPVVMFGLIFNHTLTFYGLPTGQNTLSFIRLLSGLRRGWIITMQPLSPPLLLHV